MAAVSVVGALACTESRARAPPAPAALPLGAPRFVRQERDTSGTCHRRGSPAHPFSPRHYKALYRNRICPSYTSGPW